MISLLTGGNSMITGVPGLAKTLLIATVAQVLHLNFKHRIQFTPDLMPADITGTTIIEEDRATGWKRERVFVGVRIFANIILADEINRTPPKTQSALLEAMQERSVTVRRVTYKLDPCGLCSRHPNPIELEGTYPLPEAQLDRFMFNIVIDYLSEEEEIQVVGRASNHPPGRIRKDHQRSGSHRVQRLVRQMPVAESVMRYAVRLAAYQPSEWSQPMVRQTVRELRSQPACLNS